MDLSNLKIKDLNELIEKAHKRIAELKKTEEADVRAKIVAMAKEAGFDAVQLLTGSSKVAASGDKVRRPAKPKYKDPGSDATWTGRGLKPVWVRNAVAAGKSLESLLIK
jgi:DNA-binding protein H-NS